MAEDNKKRVASVSAYTRSFFNNIHTSEEAGQIYSELRNLKDEITEGGGTEAEAFQKFVENLPFLSENTVALLAGLGEDTEVSAILAAIEEFVFLYERDNLPVNMVITSAVPLQPEQRDRIIQAVRKRMDHHHLYITEVVDESLLGGVKLESENYYYDNTLRTKLQDMRDHLLEKQ